MDHAQLIDVKTVAQIMGVTRRYVDMQRSRQKKRIAEEKAAGLAGEPRPSDIPDPELVVGRSPLWRRETIVRWNATRPSPGRRNHTNR